jgi:opacity protein-like surface antigen
MSAVLLLTLTAAPVHAESANESAPLMQVFLGVMEPDDQTGQWDAVSEGPVDIDFSSLPSGGVEAEYLFGSGWVHWGLNPGGSISWKNDDTNFSGSLTNENGGTLRFEADNSLFLAELHLGAYVRGRLSERVTTYAAAGPMVMYGSHDIKNENFEQVPSQGAPSSTADIDETDSSDINVGYYARAGIDFAINDKQQMGLGVRYLSTELDFDKTVGKLDIKGPQYVLTFTTQL